MRILSIIITLFLVIACGQKEQGAQKAEEAVAQTDVKTNLDLHQHDSAIVMHADSLYACPMNAEYVTSDPDARCVLCEMKLKPSANVKTDKDLAKIEMYTCPMHPQYLTSSATDHCPICEMKLQKVN